MTVAQASRRHRPTVSTAARTDLSDEDVRRYWNTQVHDAEVTRSPAGTRQFFEDLEAYRFRKLDYLYRILDFDRYADRDVLEVGCGIGLDLSRFALSGARAVGVDLSETGVALAKLRFEFTGAAGDLLVANGSVLPFADESFDFVFCHGVLPYASDPAAIIRESFRVLRKGGEALFMAYHRRSWLHALSRFGGVRLAHSDAPVLRTETRATFRRMLGSFESCAIVTERFPVATRLHGGWKASVFNRLFVPFWRLVPAAVVQPFGWHLLAFCRRLG